MASTSEQADSFGYPYRLHYTREYRRFFGRAQAFRLPGCSIFRIPNDLGHFRLGITLKARGTSVQRNFVKRTIRESMRKLRPSLGSFDYNVVVPSGKKMDFVYAKKLGGVLRKDFLEALKKNA